MKNIFGKRKGKIDFFLNEDLIFRQFGDANPNSIESGYYERTINSTYMYGADHI